MTRTAASNSMSVTSTVAGIDDENGGLELDVRDLDRRGDLGLDLFADLLEELFDAHAQRSPSFFFLRSTSSLERRRKPSLRVMLQTFIPSPDALSRFMDAVM